MKRAMTTLALVLCLSTVVGLLPSAAPGQCRDVCTGDDAEGDCPPFCDECVCCSSPAASVAVNRSGDAGAAPGAVTGGQEAANPPQPSPREILHVPKPALS